MIFSKPGSLGQNVMLVYDFTISILTAQDFGQGTYLAGKYTGLGRQIN